MATRIFIVEDHPLMRAQLAEFLEAFDSVEVCGSSASGEEALELIDESRADLALVDVSLPGMNGFALAEEMKMRFPGVGCLMLSGHWAREYVQRARKVGVRGYVAKGDIAGLEEALTKVTAGGTYFKQYD